MKLTRIRKSVEVDISETLYANVTLGVEEIVQFISECNTTEKAEILEALSPIETAMKVKVSTLDDVQKMEAIIELYNKHTSAELEQFLKN